MLLNCQAFMITHMEPQPFLFLSLYPFNQQIQVPLPVWGHATFCRRGLAVINQEEGSAKHQKERVSFLFTIPTPRKVLGRRAGSPRVPEKAPQVKPFSLLNECYLIKQRPLCTLIKMWEHKISLSSQLVILQGPLYLKYILWSEPRNEVTWKWPRPWADQASQYRPGDRTPQGHQCWPRSLS